MDELDQSQIGVLSPEHRDFSQQPRRVSRLLLLWPLAGVIALILTSVTYPPLDDTLIYWIGGVPCFISATLINVAWRREQSGADVRSFFPPTVWLAIGCVIVPLILLANGAWDHSPVEQHRQIISRTILSHGRGGSTFYYVECSSWRGRSHEKLMVSIREYVDSRPGDPVIIETHRGAFRIPLLVSVHRPD